MRLSTRTRSNARRRRRGTRTGVVTAAALVTAAVTAAPAAADDLSLEFSAGHSAGCQETSALGWLVWDTDSTVRVNGTLTTDIYPYCESAGTPSVDFTAYTGMGQEEVDHESVDMDDFVIGEPGGFHRTIQVLIQNLRLSSEDAENPGAGIDLVRVQVCHDSQPLPPAPPVTACGEPEFYAPAGEAPAGDPPTG